ncbi:ABC transporter ATP-binding protein [Nocardia sp. BMG51109]|uniref:ABC transporter ATP-binding protein n=1 Tax=Nocardia sp. BMG51109 TaxID=1056816 RepID=UPI00046711B7|nr:ABC transporter ATP-binding protein [Nocardia sp. BMG51109]
MSTSAAISSADAERAGYTKTAPAEAAPSLVLERVGLTFGNGTHALRDVDFAVRPGEFVSLVGPSGCGKSTLLRLAAGFERPTSGTVDVATGRLGYIFQEATLLAWRSVLANVELPAELAGADRRTRRAGALDAIERVGLAGFEKHKPAQLSGGMRMRASIARALTLRPELFLFDEPFGALDEITRQRLNQEVSQLFLRDSFAGVFVTHSVAEAVYMSTRVIVLTGRPGRVAAEIPVPLEFPRDPGIRFTAEFGEIATAVSAALHGAERETAA